MLGSNISEELVPAGILFIADDYALYIQVKYFLGMESDIIYVFDIMIQVI